MSELRDRCAIILSRIAEWLRTKGAPCPDCGCELDLSGDCAHCGEQARMEQVVGQAEDAAAFRAAQEAMGSLRGVYGG
jgi:hypothetical protein